MRKSVLRGATEEDRHMTAPSSNSGTRVRPDRGSTPTTPRWVQWFVALVIVLVVLFVILHLTGNGFGGLHGHTAPAPALARVLEPGGLPR